MCVFFFFFFGKLFINFTLYAAMANRLWHKTHNSKHMLGSDFCFGNINTVSLTRLARCDERQEGADGEGGGEGGMRRGGERAMM